MSEPIGYNSAKAYNAKIQKYATELNKMMKMLSEGGVQVSLDVKEDKKTIANFHIPKIAVVLSLPIREEKDDD